ncbi:MAG: YkgJ family cysteine cluster protein [Gemmataceae bacterium]|nr:YkgJ family cysteine cluster protein [Gemmataceae bacterium]MCI0739034.1 YkgJ family cysteine cluster protein [Gemmataceae bacterium]
MANDELDCLTCGACCVSPFLGEGYVPLEREEEERLGRMGLPVLQIVAEPSEESVTLLGTKVDRQRLRVCAALEGKVAEEVYCSIYDARPEHCRRFERGSPECLQARVALGL